MVYLDIISTAEKGMESSLGTIPNFACQCVCKEETTFLVVNQDEVLIIGYSAVETSDYKPPKDDRLLKRGVA